MSDIADHDHLTTFHVVNDTPPKWMLLLPWFPSSNTVKDFFLHQRSTGFALSSTVFPHKSSGPKAEKQIVDHLNFMRSRCLQLLCQFEEVKYQSMDSLSEDPSNPHQLDNASGCRTELLL